MATDFLSNILSSLSSGSKNSVFMSISPRNGLEVAQIDPATRTVQKYGYRFIEYNEALKEIKDFADLKKSIEELFAELQINLKSNIVLSIPTVHIGKIDLPLILSEEMVQEAIISEVEQAYIFKRCEPVVSWIEVLGNQDSENRTMIYSAVQKPTIDALKEMFTSMGATLERIEISLTTDLRALAYSGITEKQMTDGNFWTLMIIKSNGYELIQMNGSKIFDYYTEPLALKTYELEEIYDAIYTSVQISLLNFPTNNLVILSETDMVSAEHMASKMQIDGTITFVENNEYKKQDFIPVSLEILPDIASKISLDVIGVAAAKIQNIQSSFDFSGNKQVASKVVAEPIHINFQGKEYELTEPILRNIVIVLGALLIVPCLIAMLALSSVQKNSQAKLDEINSKISGLDAEIAKFKDTDKGSFDAKAEIEKVIKNNRAKLIAYSSLGESVPKRLWVSYFMTKEDGKIDIVGVSENVEDIYVFYRNLKDSIIESQLRLHRLEMQSSSVEDAISSSSNYEFEITNITEDDLKKMADAKKPDAKDASGKNKDAATKSTGSTSSSSASGGKKAVKDLEEVEVH